MDQLEKSYLLLKQHEHRATISGQGRKINTLESELQLSERKLRDMTHDRDHWRRQYQELHSEVKSRG